MEITNIYRSRESKNVTKMSYLLYVFLHVS